MHWQDVAYFITFAVSLYFCTFVTSSPLRYSARARLSATLLCASCTEYNYYLSSFASLFFADDSSEVALAFQLVMRLCMSFSFSSYINAWLYSLTVLSCSSCYVTSSFIFYSYAALTLSTSFRLSSPSVYIKLIRSCWNRFSRSASWL